MQYHLQSSDKDMVHCRPIDETLKIAHEWFSGVIDEEPKSEVFMSYFVIINDPHQMSHEFAAYFYNFPESSYPFEKETFLYAAELGHANCLEVALLNCNQYKNLEGIIILCIINGHYDCLQVALNFDNQRKVASIRYGWIKEFGWINPFVYTWYYKSSNLKVLQNRIKCFRLLWNTLGADGFTRNFRSAKKYLEYYYHVNRHLTYYVRDVLWRIFRTHVKFRMILNFWLRTTGEHTCAEGGIGRKRHLDEYRNFSISMYIIT